MIYSLFRITVITAALISLSGCAAQNMPLAQDFWKTPHQKIAVVEVKAPKPQLYKMGQQGLLDMAVNSAMTSKIDHYLNQTDLSWYATIPPNFVTQLKQHNMDAMVADEQLEDTNKSYKNFVARVGKDKILMIELVAVGAKRDYYSFIPLDAPQAYCVLLGELRNTQDNKLLWRYSVVHTQPIEKPWDQPPGYPHLADALKIAIKDAQQELLDSFFPS